MRSPPSLTLTEFISNESNPRSPSLCHAPLNHIGLTFSVRENRQDNNLVIFCGRTGRTSNQHKKTQTRRSKGSIDID